MSVKRKADDISTAISSGKKTCRQHVSSIVSYINNTQSAEERQVEKKGAQVHLTNRTSPAQSAANGQPHGGVGSLFSDTSRIKSRHAEYGSFLRALKPPVDKLVDDETILLQLQKHTNLHGQMHELCRVLLLTDEEVASRWEYCSALQAMLSFYFPGCTLKLFGSSDNGYGCKGCDMDLFLDFGRGVSYSEEEWKTAARRLKKAKLPGVHKVECDPGERERLGGQHPCLKLRFLVKLFYYHLRPVLSSCFYIPARCPIVRFIDNRGNRQCDINATSRTSLVNTNLLKTFNQCDSRLQPLLLTARTWFRVHGLLDSRRCFSSYAVSLLVCVYLQCVDPPVLPTLDQLAELHSKAGGKPEFADGYRCDFAQDKGLLPSSNNTADLGKLLEGFFQFLFSFNYKVDAIIVRSATVAPRSTLYEMLDDTNVAFFEKSPVAVQDPFVLHNNVTRLVNPRAVDILIERARDASEACRDGKDLVWLLSVQPQIRKTDISTKEEDKYELSLSTCNSGRFICDSEEWLNEVCDLLLQILLAYRIEYSVVHRGFTGEGGGGGPWRSGNGKPSEILATSGDASNEALPSNSTSLQHMSNKCRMVMPGCDECLMRLNCRLDRTIWENRREKKVLVENVFDDNDLLTFELMVSNLLWPEATPCIMDFQLMVFLQNARRSALHIVLRSVASSAHFLQMCYSLFSKQWISDTVKYYMH